MEIKDIQSKQGNIDVVFIVVSKEEPRTFEKFGKEGRVCNAKVKDDSGEIILTLWNEQIDEINIGDKVHLQNGWCGEYKDERQLSAGKFGKLEVIEKSGPALVTNDPEILSKGLSNETTEDSVDLGDSPELIDEEELIE